MAVRDTRDIVIEATPDEILDVLYDLESLPEWFPTTKSVEVLERDEEGRPLRAKQVVKVVGIPDEQVLAYASEDDGVSWTLESAKGQRAQEGRYTLTPQGDSTKVHFSLMIDLTIPVPGFLIKQGIKGIMDTATKGLRKRVLEVKKGQK
jgi:ribosome-associated toxin RatA of RatAB toxin-antitoxin module